MALKNPKNARIAKFQKSAPKIFFGTLRPSYSQNIEYRTKPEVVDRNGS